MYILSKHICRSCCHASAEDIRSWSFGPIIRARPDATADWRDRKGTLDDEAIFGPVTAYKCACQKYIGKEYAKWVCDVCGVKITSNKERCTRFGHINLSVPIPHRICGGTNHIDAFPVLPARIRESVHGGQLNAVLETLLSASDHHDVVALTDAYWEVCSVLGPIVTAAAEWALHDAQVLCRGMGLILGPATEGARVDNGDKAEQ